MTERNIKCSIVWLLPCGILHRQSHRLTHIWKHGSWGMFQILTFLCLSCPWHIRLHAVTYSSTLTDDFEIKFSIIFLHVLWCPVSNHHKSHDRCEWIRRVLLLLKNAVHQKLLKRHRNSQIFLKSEYYILQITIYVLLLPRFKERKSAILFRHCLKQCKITRKLFYKPCCC